MGLMIPDDVLQAAHMAEDELKQEIAVLLFQRERLTLGQASAFAAMSQLRFQHLLAARKIPVHYDVAELEQDLQTLRDLNRL